MVKIAFSVIIFGLLLFAFVNASTDSGIDFLSLPKEAWNAQNVTLATQEVKTGALNVRGTDVALLAAVEPFDAVQFRNFRVTLLASEYLKGVMLWGRDGSVAGDTFEIRGSNEPQEYFVDLWQFRSWIGEFNNFGIGWTGLRGEPREREIKILKMSLEGSYTIPLFWGNVKRVFTPEVLWPYSINALAGWFFGLASFTWLLGLIFIAIAIAAVLLLKSFKAVSPKLISSPICLIAIIFLTFWGLYDIRQIFDLGVILKDGLTQYVLPSKYEKQYYALTDFSGFLNFVKDNTRKDDVICFDAFRAWPFEQNAYYFLMPRKIIVSAIKERGNCTMAAVYKVPVVEKSPERYTLWGERQIQITDIKAYKDHSFVAKILSD